MDQVQPLYALKEAQARIVSVRKHYHAPSLAQDMYVIANW